MRRLSIAICLLLFAGPESYWQTAELSPSFDVASIKLARPADLANESRFGCRGGPGTNEPGRWTCRAVSVSTLIGAAYELQFYQMMSSLIVSPVISQGTQFDVVAKVPDGTTHEQALLMQQNLLKERFKLSLHFAKRDTNGFEIIVARNGVKMKRTNLSRTAQTTPPWR